MKKPRLFIDGEAGTTGLEIIKRLENRSDIDVLRIDDAKRKDTSERKKLLNDCDLAVLCLPDAAAREALSLIEKPSVRVLDASTAHRVSPQWVYGFPEMSREQESKIRDARFVSNPGCYPTGAIALVRPLVDAKLLSPKTNITINAVSGYSGGGKELITLCQHPDGSLRTAPYCLYGLDLSHKHIPEIAHHSGLSKTPIFLPSYSSAFYRGMLVTITLRLDESALTKTQKISANDIHETYVHRYAAMKNIIIEPMREIIEKDFVLTPLEQNETNNLQLRVFGNDTVAILTACLDNLGKGASGAAVQNIDLMLGLNNAKK